MPATFEAALVLATSRVTPDEWDAMPHRSRTNLIYAAMRELDSAMASRATERNETDGTNSAAVTDLMLYRRLQQAT